MFSLVLESMSLATVCQISKYHCTKQIRTKQNVTTKMIFLKYIIIFENVLLAKKYTLKCQTKGQTINSSNHKYLHFYHIQASFLRITNKQHYGVMKKRNKTGRCSLFKLTASSVRTNKGYLSVSWKYLLYMTKIE